MAGIKKKKDVYAESLELHEKYRGKIEIHSKVPIRNRRDLSLAYTPGVGAVCKEIHRDKNLAYKYTLKANTIAIVTDGSRVLSLGNIGGYAAIPVMEGKALLFKKLAGIDAFPICFESFHTEFVDEVKNIAPVFGGIALEDIAAPKCFELEDALQGIGIPVMHDDQHGTAVVVLAALLNACRVTKKRFEDLNIVVCGAGAAGFAITRILRCIGYDPNLCSRVNDIIVCDTKGIIHRQRDGLYANKYKFIIAEETNKAGRTGTLTDSLQGSRCLYRGFSAGNHYPVHDPINEQRSHCLCTCSSHARRFFPMTPVWQGRQLLGTGRNEYPNQINYALAFPGIFRGALDVRATRISDEMKVAAAHALAEFVKRPQKDRILPQVLNRAL